MGLIWTKNKPDYQTNLLKSLVLPSINFTNAQNEKPRVADEVVHNHIFRFIPSSRKNKNAVSGFLDDFSMTNEAALYFRKKNDGNVCCLAQGYTA